MSVFIGNVKLGEENTKICVPIIGKTVEEICQEAIEITDIPADIVEWRVDFYEDVMSTDKVLMVITRLVGILKDKPVLFTFRTKAEGGEKDIAEDDYIKLIKEVIKQNIVGAVDVELFKGENVLEQISTYAKDYGVKVVASNHDFNKTPEKEEIKRRLILMKEKGAHVSKMAVMPQSEADVVTLLAATEEVNRENENMTVITMSMGKLGVISRLGGGIFGSAMTFGAKDDASASAPGQVKVELLKGILEMIESK